MGYFNTTLTYQKAAEYSYPYVSLQDLDEYPELPVITEEMVSARNQRTIIWGWQSNWKKEIRSLFTDF